ncbi:unannotated protein [freshwater metagenome]|uniref:Unannotated protein n=1 Tax=freshwater metagenome TaxID=449393 RepID=A0A6J7KPZ3_9ZZZZ
MPTNTQDCLKCGKCVIMDRHDSDEPICPECGWGVIAAKKWQEATTRLDSRGAVAPTAPRIGPISSSSTSKIALGEYQPPTRLRLFPSLKAGLWAASAVALFIVWFVLPIRIQEAAARGLTKGMCLGLPFVAISVSSLGWHWWKGRRAAKSRELPSIDSEPDTTSIESHQIKSYRWAVWIRPFARYGAVVGLSLVGLALFIDKSEQNQPHPFLEVIGMALTAAFAFTVLGTGLGTLVFYRKFLTTSIRHAFKTQLSKWLAVVFLFVFVAEFLQNANLEDSWDNQDILSGFTHGIWYGSIAVLIVLGFIVLWKLANKDSKDTPSP